MNEIPIDRITDYHAHVYFDAQSKEAAADLRSAIEERFADVRMGRWHDRPVGPHPQWSYQVAFEPALFSEIVPWLVLNRGGLTVFLHPNSGDAMRDHTDHAIWLGPQETLKLEALRG